MNIIDLINRGIRINAPTLEPIPLMDTKIQCIADLMGISVDEALLRVESHPAVDDLGDGVYRVWGVNK